MNSLIELNFKQIEALAFRMTHNTSIDFDDLVQNTCIKLVLNHNKYVVQKDSHFLSFVKVVMTRTFINMIRQKKTINRKLDSYNKFKLASNDSNILDDSSLLYQSIIKSLKNDYEINFVNLVLNGFKLKEIAKINGIPLQTAYTQYRTLKKRLKDVFL